MNAPLDAGPASWFGGPAADPWTGPGSTPTTGHSAGYRGAYGTDQRFAERAEQHEQEAREYREAAEALPRDSDTVDRMLDAARQHEEEAQLFRMSGPAASGAPYYVHVKTETGGDDTVWVEADSPTHAEAIALDLHPTAVDAIGAYPDEAGEFEHRLAAAIAADTEAAVAVAEAEQRAGEAREDDRADDDGTPAARAGAARIPVDE